MMKLIIFGHFRRNPGVNHEIEQIISKLGFRTRRGQIRAIFIEFEAICAKLMKSSKNDQDIPNLGEKNEIDYILSFSMKSRCIS